MPRTQNFFTLLHFLRGKVIHRRLRRAVRWRAPRRRMNNFGHRIKCGTKRRIKCVREGSEVRRYLSIVRLGFIYRRGLACLGEDGVKGRLWFAVAVE
jgi:hypothetical protein